MRVLGFLALLLVAGEMRFTRTRHEMIEIKGPVTFMMGSPTDEALRDTTEVQHRVIIPRSFALAAKETTVEQFQEFLDENPFIKRLSGIDSTKSPVWGSGRLMLFSPDRQCPQIFVTWYEAAQYCNWLSKKEGIPADQWCYPSLEKITNGMRLPSNYLHRTGYRLPTEAEWEYACRAGSGASHFFGPSDDSLVRYAWYRKHPPKRMNDPIDPTDPQHSYPVGRLKPNAWGFFDMYGNVWEWCQSHRLPYVNGSTEDREEDNQVIDDSTAMTRRGGSYAYGRETTRSAHRGATTYFPNQRRDGVGFRVARTIR